MPRRIVVLVCAAALFPILISTAYSKDYRLYATGGNDHGQLGFGDTVERHVFTQVPDLRNIRAVACGDRHAVILDGDGVAYTAGLNSNGQLGLGHTTSMSTFTAITNPTTVTAIGAGSVHSLLIVNSDKVWASGYNYYGGLGVGDNSPHSSFTLSNGVGNAIAVAGMDYSTIALKDTGRPYNTGYNGQGQLGTGDNTNTNTFSVVSTFDVGEAIGIGAGGEHSLVVKEDGTVWVTGWNNQGQLGLGDTLDRNAFTVVPDIAGAAFVTGGFANSFIVKDDGTVLATGRNDAGQLGLGNTADRSYFAVVPGLTNIKAVAASMSNTLAVGNDGSLWVCGGNSRGDLGVPSIGSRTSQFVRVPDLSFVEAADCGTSFSLAVAAYGVDLTFPTDTDLVIERGRKYLITWDSFNLPKGSKVKIELVNGDNVWLLSAGASKSPFKWTVGKPLKDQPAYDDGEGYRIRITTPDGTDSDESEEPFAIGTPQSITVSGNESVVGGDITQQYTCTAHYNFGPDQNVTSWAKWKTSPSTYAKMTKTGLLLSKIVPMDQGCLIIATYSKLKLYDDLAITLTAIP